MKNHEKTLGILVAAIFLLAAFASAAGIFSGGGPGPVEVESIHGAKVTLYGTGIYRNMSVTLVPQGVAQDYVTLFLAIPVLLASCIFTTRGSLKARFVLSGTLLYFFTTYLFYLTMIAYNELFLVYSALFGLSFFSLALALAGFEVAALPARFGEKAPTRASGILLVFLAATIGLLWLGTVVPPLLDGTIYPASLEHYTTLIVQGIDLGFGLPLAAVSGILLLRKKPLGYLLGPVYIVFLSLLMTALNAKIVAMGLAGSSVIPVVFIMPLFALASIAASCSLIRKIR